MSTKNVLIPLELTAAASAADAGIHKKNGIWNNNFNNFKWKHEWYKENYSSSWRFNILLKGITKTIKNETKQEKEM